MEDLSRAPASAFANIRFVLTDMDETLTRHGRLAARTYDALERLQHAGLKVIPVTAAPAGWCDQMARMWPVDGVIAENGGLFIARSGADTVTRTHWHSSTEQAGLMKRLVEVHRAVKSRAPSARLADDQPFRLTSLAFARPDDAETQEEIRSALVDAGANATSNNLWLLGWIGAYDKLAMSLRVLSEVYGLSPDDARTAIAYCGDSENDAPMFGHFEQTFGMSTVRGGSLSSLPRWITEGAGGDGFVEVADRIIRDRPGV